MGDQRTPNVHLAVRCARWNTAPRSLMLVLMEVFFDSKEISSTVERSFYTR